MNQADAWIAVFDTLEEVSPGFHLGQPPRHAAVRTIRRLASDRNNYLNQLSALGARTEKAEAAGEELGEVKAPAAEVMTTSPHCVGYTRPAPSAGTIRGYRDLTKAEVDLINEVKAEGERIGKLLDKVESLGTDRIIAMTGASDSETPFHQAPEWVATGRTHLQQGLMALTRAVACPEGFA